MSGNKILKRLRSRLFGKHVLIAMHSEDMERIHPRTDFSRACSRCGGQVGLYPSGQALIRLHGAANMEIICNRCAGADVAQKGQPAPGALEEVGQSIPNPKKK